MKEYPGVIMTQGEAEEIAKLFDFDLDKVFTKEKGTHRL